MLDLHCYFGDNVKYELLQNTCLKERSNMAVEKISVLQNTLWNIISSSKQVVSITYTLEKVFVAASFEGLGVLFRQCKQTCIYFTFVFFTFPEKAVVNRYYL